MKKLIKLSLLGLLVCCMGCVEGMDPMGRSCSEVARERAEFKEIIEKKLGVPVRVRGVPLWYNVHFYNNGVEGVRCTHLDDLRKRYGSIFLEKFNLSDSFEKVEVRGRKVLRISRRFFSDDEDFSWVKKLKRSKKLWLSYVEEVDRFCKVFPQCVKAATFDRTDITDEGVKLLSESHAERLTTLDFFRCPKMTEQSFEHLKKFKNLYFLGLTLPEGIHFDTVKNFLKEYASINPGLKRLFLYEGHESVFKEVREWFNEGLQVLYKS